MRAKLAHLHLKDERGSAAVEFALVAGPLIFLICACIELAVVILLSVTLDNATSLAARDIRTGLTTKTNTSVIQFKQKVCDHMGWLGGSCMSSLQVDIRSYSTFAELAAAPPPIKDGVFITTFSYDIGLGSKVQLVRTYYEWPLMTPFLDGGLAKLSNHDAVISSTAVFRNEPF